MHGQGELVAPPEADLDRGGWRELPTTANSASAPPSNWIGEPHTEWIRAWRPWIEEPGLDSALGALAQFLVGRSFSPWIDFAIYPPDWPWWMKVRNRVIVNAGAPPLEVTLRRFIRRRKLGVRRWKAFNRPLTEQERRRMQVTSDRGDGPGASSRDYRQVEALIRAMKADIAFAEKLLNAPRPPTDDQVQALTREAARTEIAEDAIGR